MRLPFHERVFGSGVVIMIEILKWIPHENSLQIDAGFGVEYQLCKMESIMTYITLSLVVWKFKVPTLQKQEIISCCDFIVYKIIIRLVGWIGESNPSRGFQVKHVGLSISTVVVYNKMTIVWKLKRAVFRECSLANRGTTGTSI